MTHIEARRKLQGVATVKEFNELLDRCTLTDEEKEIMRLHYLKGKDYCFIADLLGFSESTIKRRHKTIISKLKCLL